MQHRLLAFTFGAALFVSGAHAQTACLTGALTDYTRANLALMQQIPMTVDATIAQRRLEEQYCMRSTRCLLGEPANTATGMAFAVEFSKCLRKETLEKSK
jgi:hypothetical protein